MVVVWLSVCDYSAMFVLKCLSWAIPNLTASITVWHNHFHVYFALLSALLYHAHFALLSALLCTLPFWVHCCIQCRIQDLTGGGACACAFTVDFELWPLNFLDKPSLFFHVATPTFGDYNYNYWIQCACHIYVFVVSFLTAQLPQHWQQVLL